MGIHGLIPFVKDATEQINIKKYAGYTVAVDTYCWLHKGAFACAMQLAKGEQTDLYIRYCMKFVNMLRSFNVKPILVFDGCNLPSKKHVENSRRERRETFMNKGKQFLREGKVNEARDCFTKSINITSEMALDVMNAARSLGVDCIVAPYEADAQLAYLNKCGIAQAIITEDSDLIAFGCGKVVVKMDINGNGLEIDSTKLDKAMKIGTKYSIDKFRYMCIISGCDYLPSLPGIGLGKARKLFLLSSNPDINQILKKMPMHLKMKLVVGDDYIEGFHQANNTFLYQLAFDPLKRKLVPLNPYPPEIQPVNVSYAGKYIDDSVALEMALGNVNVNTGRKVAHYIPDWNKSFDRKMPCHLLSIWHKKYKPGPKYGTADPLKVQHPTTKNKQTIVKTPATFSTKEKKQKFREDCESVESEHDLTLMYGSPTKSKQNVVPETPEKELEELPASKLKQQPKVRRNRFAVKRLSSQERSDLINQGATQNSRFFSSEPTKANIKDSEEESDSDSKNNSILLSELDELAENNQDEEIPECETSTQSKLPKYKRSSPFTSDTNVLTKGTSDSEVTVQENSTGSQSSFNQNDSKIKTTDLIPSPVKSRRQTSSTGAFSWKKKIGKNEVNSESQKRQQSNSIKSFLSSFRRNSNFNGVNHKLEEKPVTITISDDELSQDSIQLSQISDLYSIDGDTELLTQPSQTRCDLSQTQQNLTQSSQSQQNLTQSSQTQQNLTQSSQSQQNLTQSSQSQQNLTQSSQSQQNLTQLSQSLNNFTNSNQMEWNSSEPILSQRNSKQNLSQENQTYVNLSQEVDPTFHDILPPTSKTNCVQLTEPRLPEFDLSSLNILNCGANQKLAQDSISSITSSYFSKDCNNDDSCKALDSCTSLIKPNKVRCGLRQARSSPTTPVTTLGPSKKVGLKRVSSKKRKASDENNTRQVKMTKFFTSTNTMVSDDSRKKAPLSPVNSPQDSTPECEMSLRLIEGSKVQRNIFK